VALLQEQLDHPATDEARYSGRKDAHRLVGAPVGKHRVDGPEDDGQVSPSYLAAMFFKIGSS
jgi:hypothetical protein